MNEETIESPAGTFKVVLYYSRNDQLQKRWVYSVQSPDDALFQGFSRSRRGAARKVRRWIAHQEAAILLRTRRERASLEAAEMLRREGVEKYHASRLERCEDLQCSLLRPGELMCSYRVQGFGGSESWQAVIFLDGRESVSEQARSRRGAQKAARRSLQKVYEHEALRSLGPAHAPD